MADNSRKRRKKKERRLLSDSDTEEDGKLFLKFKIIVHFFRKVFISRHGPH